MHELFLRDLSLWSCVWQSTLFAVIGLAGSFLLRRRPARASQVLFIAIIAAVLLPAMSTLVRHYGLGLFAGKLILLPSFEIEKASEMPEILLEPEIQPAAHVAPTDFTLAESSSETVEIPWRSIGLCGWMIVTLILLGRLFVAFVSGIRLLRRAQSDRCEHIRPAADSARARLGITKSLKVRSSKDVRSPMIWCWNHPPILLVPDDLDEQFDWIDVICHELAHWRRWDHVSGLMTELAVCILPWNPLLWWSKKRMVRLSEQACDDWVLMGGRAGTDYAQSLLNLSPELQMAFMPTVIGKEKPMKKRIYRIVKEKCGIPQVGARWALVVTMIAAVVTVGVALAQRRPARFEQLEQDERIAAERRERQVLAERRTNLENRARELRARLDEVRAELAELEESGRAESDKAHALRSELRDLEKVMERLERELRELEGDRRQREMRPWPDREPPREILRRLEELSRETEFLLQGLADQRIGRNDETNMLYNRMRELNEQMRQVRQQLGRRLESPDRQRPELDELGRERGRSRRGQQAGQQVRPEVMRLEQEELKERARQIELELEELGDGHPQEAQELRMQLDKVHQQMQRNRRELDRLQRRWPRVEEPIQPGIERHRQNLMVQREQIQAQMRELEHVLQELNEQEKAESEEAHEHRMQMDVLQQQLRAIENEFRESKPGRAQQRGRDDLEREVQNLRKQMDGMNEQMVEMRELMKRLLQKNESPETL